MFFIQYNLNLNLIGNRKSTKYFIILKYINYNKYYYYYYVLYLILNKYERIEIYIITYK